MTPITEPLWPADYNVAPDHCLDTLLGAYDVPFDPATPPVVLDIGANVGAFVRWAAARWPGCTIHAYEPFPGNYDLLRRTVETIPNVFTYPVAVAKDAGRAMLYEGQFNCGEWSLHPSNWKAQVEVDLIPAMSLPKADVIKVDTEGAEVAILGSLYMGGRIKEFSAVMMECHSASWVEPFKVRMAQADFTLTGEIIHGEHRREMKWVRSDLLRQDLATPSPST